MPVVSNTSPLLNLAIIDELRLVREQLGDIMVPTSVVSELRVDSEMPGAAVLRQALEEGWLHVEQVEQHSFVRALQRELDAGEAETIVLALERDASLLLIDEWRDVESLVGLGSRQPVC